MARTDPNPAERPVRVAILRHDACAQGDHLDLLVGPVTPSDPDARTARCWRLPLEAWHAEGFVHGRFAATALPLHREEYLELRAPRDLSDQRGRVTPLFLGSGSARAIGPQGADLALSILGVRIDLGGAHAEIRSIIDPTQPDPHCAKPVD